MPPLPPARPPSLSRRMPEKNLRQTCNPFGGLVDPISRKDVSDLEVICVYSIIYIYFYLPFWRAWWIYRKDFSDLEVICAYCSYILVYFVFQYIYCILIVWSCVYYVMFYILL